MLLLLLLLLLLFLFLFLFLLLLLLLLLLLCVLRSEHYVLDRNHVFVGREVHRQTIELELRDATIGPLAHIRAQHLKQHFVHLVCGFVEAEFPFERFQLAQSLVGEANVAQTSLLHHPLRRNRVFDSIKRG